MDMQTESLLKMDFDAWKDAGSPDAAFRELEQLPGVPIAEAKAKAEPAAKEKADAGAKTAVPATSATPNGPGASRIDKLIASWPQGKDYDVPAGQPLLREVRFLKPEERSLVHKSALAKQFVQAGDKVQALYDGIILGETHQAQPLIEIAETLLSLLVGDPFGTLGLTLLRGQTTTEYQYRHAVNTCVLSMAAATAGGFAKAQVVDIGVGGLIADLGMLLVPDEVLGKVGKLSPEELRTIHRHVQQGVEMLERLQGLSNTVLTIVLQHHERLMGSGYPRNLKGQAISHAARAVAIGDTLAAMIHKRSHRDAMLPQEALDRVLKMGQMQFLDPAYVKALASWLSAYPVGSGVHLQSGRVARVIAANLDDFQRPVVAVLRSADGQPLPLKQILPIDLRTSQDKIVKAVDDAEAGFKGLDGF